LQNFIDNNNGLYSLDIVCNTSDSYEITIILTKPYHYNTSDSFILIIGETGSELELLNGTADVTLFGDSYRLVVEYRNSTGHGLSGADLQIVTVTPDTGLIYGSFTPMGGGFYEITFDSSSAGTFSIVIGASIINHESQYTTFTLTVSGIPTILTSIPSTKTVAVNQSFVLQLRFWDESLNPIDSAIITVINPPTGITISAASWVGNGLYNITLQSSEISTFDLLFRATLVNYQSSSAGFTFVVTEIQTTLSFEDVTSTVVEFAEPFELIVYYDGNDPVEAVQGANITVFPAVAELDIDIVEYTGYYIITIRGNDVGSWALTILANKTDHRVATKSFFIEVEEIDTTVQGSSPLETLLIGCSYDFTFSFIFESNSSYIRGATINPFGAGADWVTFVELGSGQYSVNLTPQELGEHSVIVTFERIGFESASFRLTFTVGRVPITIEVLQGLSAPEYGESVVSVRIIEVDSGNPVSGVQVFCYIIDPNGAPSSSIAMTETDTAGVYSTTISMPIAEGQYQLQITCDGANYVMNTEFSVNLEPERSFTSMVWVTTTQYYPIILLFAALGVGLVYRKSARKKRIRENKETLAIKKRFDDIRSLMGVIVLHKDSGLPVYSKILRDGLEEVVISAFITAITSFRGEFDIESSSEEWGLIPISDIIRVISTNKLVCAFITTGNPSPEQRERMIRYAKTVAFIFDETMEDVPIVVLDHHTTQQFNTLFEDILDGQLLRTYKLDDAKKFPTTSCANERIARLVTTDDSPFATELLRAPDIVEEES
jgi:5-hydroxyisourate hydrolase-like protein (transthyretin family)